MCVWTLTSEFFVLRDNKHENNYKIRILYHFLEIFFFFFEIKLKTKQTKKSLYLRNARILDRILEHLHRIVLEIVENRDGSHSIELVRTLVNRLLEVAEKSQHLKNRKIFTSQNKNSHFLLLLL